MYRSTSSTTAAQAKRRNTEVKRPMLLSRMLIAGNTPLQNTPMRRSFR
jgi:hypothetical protein